MDGDGIVFLSQIETNEEEQKEEATHGTWCREKGRELASSVVGAVLRKTARLDKTIRLAAPPRENHGKKGKAYVHLEGGASCRSCWPLHQDFFPKNFTKQSSQQILLNINTRTTVLASYWRDATF